MIFTASNRAKRATASAPETAADGKGSFLRLLRLTLPYRRGILAAAGCVLIVNLAVIVKPYILKLVIDDFFVARRPQRGLYTIASMGVLYLLVALSGSLFSYLQSNIINRAGQNIIMDLRARLFRTIQYLPLSYLDKTSSGRLITRATNDVEALSQLYTDVLLNLFQDVFLLLGIAYTMFALDFRLALLSFVVIPPMAAALFLLRKTIKRNFSRVKALIGRINGFMAENISGMRLIQVFKIEKVKRAEFRKLNDDYSRSTLLQVRLNSILKPGTDLCQSLTIAVLLWYGMDKVAGHALAIGVLYAFTTYVKQFFSPIADLADQYTTIQSAMVSAARIFDLLDQEPIGEDLDAGQPMEPIRGDIEFDHVWFAYNGEDWVLKDVSFRIRRGQTAAFVGETGAGKTTIISLINGFYRAQKGRILVDGVEIGRIRLRDLRLSIAVVLQDVFLFSGNIRENIGLNDEIGEAQMSRALEVSCADEFVGSLPGELGEPVMENGSTFSAGQKQLLAFARAIAHKPSILICDEATANIDTHTEKLIQKAIETISRDTTTLIIAHRLSTVREADQIIVMDHGRVAESGTHEQLVKAGRVYYHMLERDAG